MQGWDVAGLRTVPAVRSLVWHILVFVWIMILWSCTPYRPQPFTPVLAPERVLA
jgi:hypothetical protein